MEALRRFFASRGFLEVETPLMVPSPGLELHLDAFPVERSYLITSPEYQLKRLLAAGVDRVYSLCKCFRRGEAGRHHNPEFTMVEWYRSPGNWEEIARDVEDLVHEVVRAVRDVRTGAGGAGRFDRRLRGDGASAAHEDAVGQAPRLRAGIRRADVAERPQTPRSVDDRATIQVKGPIAGSDSIPDTTANRPETGTVPPADSQPDSTAQRLHTEPFPSQGNATGDANGNANGNANETPITYQGTPLSLKAPWQWLGVAEAMARWAGVTMDPETTVEELRQRGRAAGHHVPDSLTAWDDVFFSIFLDAVDPKLGRDCPTILHHWPPQLAALARIGADGWAERFEGYAAGLELANGFGELLDPVEQRARFEHERAERARRGLPLYPIDERFLAALGEGIPPSAGVALGVDRLVMLACDAPSVRDVLAFTVDEL